MAKRKNMGQGPDDSKKNEQGLQSIQADRVGSQSAGRFLTRAQRNQAAFAAAVTGRCGCHEDGCVDCTHHQMWKGLLASDAGLGSQEY